MTSERKVLANRKNAKRSTGPRTAAGKDRSSRNARRHGLAAATSILSTGSPELEQLARAIAGKEPSPARLHYCRMIAESEITQRLVDEATAKRIEQIMSDADTFSAKPPPYFPLYQEALEALDPSQVAHLGPLAKADFAEMLAQFNAANAHRKQIDDFRLSRPAPEEAVRPGLALMSVAKELRRYQRYVRRALARRKRAGSRLRWLSESEAAATLDKELPPGAPFSEGQKGGTN